MLAGVAAVLSSVSFFVVRATSLAHSTPFMPGIFQSSKSRSKGSALASAATTACMASAAMTR